MLNWIKRLFRKKEPAPAVRNYSVFGIIPTVSYGEPPLRAVYREEDSGGDFLTSALVAGATDSAAIGALIGGDPLGAVIGAGLSDSGGSDYTSSDFSGSDEFSGGGGESGGGGASGDW